MRKFSYSIFAVFFGIMLMINQSCKKDDPKVEKSLLPAQEDNSTNRESWSIRKDVLHIEPQDAKLISNEQQLDAGVYIFEFRGTVPELRNIKTIASRESEFCRKIISYEISDNKVVFQTEKADLTDYMVGKLHVDLGKLLVDYSKSNIEKGTPNTKVGLTWDLDYIDIDLFKILATSKDGNGNFTSPVLVNSGGTRVELLEGAKIRWQHNSYADFDIGANGKKDVKLVSASGSYLDIKFPLKFAVGANYNPPRIEDEILGKNGFVIPIPQLKAFKIKIALKLKKVQEFKISGDGCTGTMTITDKWMSNAYCQANGVPAEAGSSANEADAKFAIANGAFAMSGSIKFEPSISISDDLPEGIKSAISGELFIKMGVGVRLDMKASANPVGSLANGDDLFNLGYQAWFIAEASAGMKGKAFGYEGEISKPLVTPYQYVIFEYPKSIELKSGDKQTIQKDGESGHKLDQDIVIKTSTKASVNNILEDVLTMGKPIVHIFMKEEDGKVKGETAVISSWWTVFMSIFGTTEKEYIIRADSEGNAKFTWEMPSNLPGYEILKFRAILYDGSGKIIGKEITGECYNQATFTDPRDGEEYDIVHLAEGETWFAQNLRYYKNSLSPWSPGAENGVHPEYGRSYPHAQVSSWLFGEGDLCPSGWHVPTSSEWGTMLGKVGLKYGGIIMSNSGGRLLKAVDTDIPGSMKWNATYPGLDSTGFKALPARYYYSSGGTPSFATDCWWSTTSDFTADEFGIMNASAVRLPDMSYGSPNTILFEEKDRTTSMSIRCKKD